LNTSLTIRAVQGNKMVLCWPDYRHVHGLVAGSESVSVPGSGWSTLHPSLLP